MTMAAAARTPMASTPHFQGEERVWGLLTVISGIGASEGCETVVGIGGNCLEGAGVWTVDIFVAVS